MSTNGTAVAVVNVTGAAIRLTVPVASMGRVPVASQYGAVFASHGSAVIEQDVCRGTQLLDK
jgi:hypothetical protein